MEWYLIIIFSDYSKLAGKVSKKHVYIYCVTRCSCFSQLSLLVVLCLFYFSVFLLLLEYVKLDNSFSYLVLVEVCMFLIIFIFIILSMFVCITYFCCIYSEKKCKIKYHFNKLSFAWYWNITKIWRGNKSYLVGVSWFLDWSREWMGCCIAYVRGVFRSLQSN